MAAEGTSRDPTPDNWATQQLGEFLSFVSSYAGEPEALQRAVEHSAEILDAEIAALVVGRTVIASVGFASKDVPADDLLDLAEQAEGAIDVPGIGMCGSVSVLLERKLPHRLLIARSQPATFDEDEMGLIRGMARVVAVGLRTADLLETERSLRARSERQGAENVVLLGALRERQALLERLSELQRAIVNRTALNEVLELVGDGVKETLGNVVVSVRLLDSERVTTRLVTSVGATQGLLGRWREARTIELLSRDALENGRVTTANPADQVQAEAEFATTGVQAAISVPLYERGAVVGSLAVGTRSTDHRFEPTDEEVVLAFAEHASLALNDARAAEEAMHEAFHDSLTDLPNRSLFIDRLEHALARATREGSPVAVLFCDLDGFKTVNDSLGHAAGDRLLRLVGERLADSLRPADTVARIGGDEFAILLEELGEPEDSARAATRVLENLASPFAVEGRELFVAASIGIAAAESGDDANAILRNADLAMYRAKARGKGRYEVFESTMHADVVRRMEVELDLKRAIERDQIVVHYQPIFDLPSGEVSGVEALVRWDHPKRGLLLPGEFIPIAEESGQIAALGRHVLRDACRQIALWRAKYPAYEWLYASVNVSGVQLRSAELVDEVDSALRAAQLDPSHLMLEMTETVLMEDSEAATARLEALRGLGVRLAIDDFGTGYSSLEYLNRLPIDALKIAKPFVDGLGGGPGSDAIPRAIADLAEIFGLVTVAEGIERAEQGELLVELGCRFGQGNALSPSLDPEAADAALFGAGLLQRGLNPEGRVEGLSQKGSDPSPGAREEHHT